MRKRAQRKSKITVEEPKHVKKQKTTVKRKTTKAKRNWWLAVSLVGIFLLVLFFNSYFNITSGQTIDTEEEGFAKFYLSGPDPYYNMRLIEQTVFGENAGHYPYLSENDPLLNYPIGESGGRRPLLNMAAIGFSRVLTPFMDEIDALGYSMQFIPSLFGALLVFPIYFIGKTLFGKREGLVAALFVALIPIHLSSGHGSAYSLFDHDSFNLLMFFLTFVFLVKSIKEKDYAVNSVLFAVLSGVSLAALSMTWVEARFIYAVIAVYAVVQMLIDIYLNKIEAVSFRSPLVVLFFGYLISLPVSMSRIGGFRPELTLFLCLAVAVFGGAYYLFGKKKIPWTISLPIVFCVAGIGLVFLYFIEDLVSYIPFLSPLGRLSTILYGSGIYGTKVSLTIAEAHTFTISHTVMSFGPALYWLGWAGFVFLAYYFYKNHERRDYLFIIVLFLVELWLTGIAGRFLNDLVPLIALLGGWMVWIIVDKIDYEQMLRNIKGAGGGLHGLRRGVKVLHIFGILFIALLVIFPNAYLALDAAVPSTMKDDVFGEDLASGAFGLPHGKEAYWIDAYSWLKEQDTDIENPVDRPAFISWWDYGFYEVAIGEHPAVADNFQDGIPPASNFHTATSEEEAVAIWTIRLMEGNLYVHNGSLSNEVVNALEKHLGENDTINITSWMEDPATSPSYNSPIGVEYNKNLSKDYRVGEQWPENAAYHDISELLTDRLDDKGITWLYHDIQEATGYSIRYYGVEGYDKQIFDIFAFLADKSLMMVSGAQYAVYNPEDDFKQIKYQTQKGNELTFHQLRNMSEEALQSDPPVINNGRYSTKTIYKDPYFETMFYKTYIGISSGSSGSKSEPNYQLPCINMRHFCAEYISNISKGVYYTNKVPVVIAKYYEGAYINGTVTFKGEPIQAEIVVQKNISHYLTSIPIDHDKTETNSNGSFNLIAPAGDITLQIRRYPNFSPVIIKNVTFNSKNNSDLYPISDDDAMRKSDNYKRIVNISIEPSEIKGYVYINKDNTTGYNASSADEHLSNVTIVLHELQDDGQSTIEKARLTTDENGYYNFSGLMPGLYVVRAEHKGFVIHEGIPAIKLLPGDNFHNISKSKPSSLEGIVYYDKDHQEDYDHGEEMEDVKVDITYQKEDIAGNILDEKLVNTTYTNQGGHYSFSSLVPGEYVIKATKYPEYESEEQVTLEENKTTNLNISIQLSPVTVDGYTKYGEEAIGNISISFLRDNSVENNTATSQLDTKSDSEKGYYMVHLKPGYYNVSVNDTIKQDNQNITYTFTGKLELQIGQEGKTYNIVMTREE